MKYVAPFAVLLSTGVFFVNLADDAPSSDAIHNSLGCLFIVSAVGMFCVAFARWL